MIGRALNLEILNAAFVMHAKILLGKNARPLSGVHPILNNAIWSNMSIIILLNPGPGFAALTPRIE
jgi:hypothetical protein